MKRSFIREILEHTNSDTISFAGGLPDEGLLPAEALRASAHKVFSNPKSLQYDTSTGYTPLKEKIAKMYCDKGFDTTSENILITSGSQQALDIICRYHDGEKIGIESPSYLGAINLFSLNHMETTAIKLHSDGIDIPELEVSLAESKLAYLIPDFQNPTGATYSEAKRKRVAELCREHGTLLIEDAPYSELYFDNPMESISSMLPHHSFHLGSFSKVLAPSLRIGWIRADQSLLQPLIAYKEAMDLHTSGITQRIVNEYLQYSNAYSKHMETLRNHYYQKMVYFADALDKYLPQFEYVRPSGGMFIYGNLPCVDTLDLVRKCMDNEVAFVPGSEFGGRRDEIRFNYTHSSFKEIEEGIKRIASAMHKCTSV